MGRPCAPSAAKIVHSILNVVWRSAIAKRRLCTNPRRRRRVCSNRQSANVKLVAIPSGLFSYWHQPHAPKFRLLLSRSCQPFGGVMLPRSVRALHDCPLVAAVNVSARCSRPLSLYVAATSLPVPTIRSFRWEDRVAVDTTLRP